jgi:pimeloyl-ACP methyl ester carboxylesterase
MSGHIEIGDLRMYHEVHGDGPPALLLHGAYMTTGMWGPFLPGLAEFRKVIAVDLEGHGRTNLRDGRITYEQMADDVAALASELGLDSVDVVGFSMGAGVGLQLAMRHHGLVRRAALLSVGFRYDSMHQVVIDMFPTLSPEMFAGSEFESEYQRIAPEPDRFADLVMKLKELDMTPFAWSEDEIRAIPSPVLVVVGDSDVVRLEPTVELFNLLGGGYMGDMSSPPDSQLAVLPGTSHFIPPGLGVMDRTEWILPMVRTFLDPPAVSDSA